MRISKNGSVCTRQSDDVKNKLEPGAIDLTGLLPHPPSPTEKTPDCRSDNIYASRAFVSRPKPKDNRLLTNSDYLPDGYFIVYDTALQPFRIQ